MTNNKGTKTLVNVFLSTIERERERENMAIFFHSLLTSVPQFRGTGLKQRDTLIVKALHFQLGCFDVEFSHMCSIKHISDGVCE